MSGLTNNTVNFEHLGPEHKNKRVILTTITLKDNIMSKTTRNDNITKSHVPCAPPKDSDQSGPLPSLIRTFDVELKGS